MKVVSPSTVSTVPVDPWPYVMMERAVGKPTLNYDLIRSGLSWTNGSERWIV